MSNNINDTSKKLFIAFAIIAALFISYNFLGYMGMLKVFRNPTTANEPALKPRSFYVSTNLMTPEKKDIIIYFYNDISFGPGLFVHRLCAIEGDVVEIKNSVLFVNGNNFDENLELKHLYEISIQDYFKLPYEITSNKDNINYKINDSIYLISLEDKMARQFNLMKQIKSTNKINEDILNTYNKNWNRDHFGPLVIPKGKVFVLGDNRHNSEDSRYRGLIDRNDIKGKVLFK